MSTPSAPSPSSAAPSGESSSGVRLAKRLAEHLSCSRREAEMYIEAGTVLVDGEIVEDLGYRITPQQEVQIQAGAKPKPVPLVTLLVHQPANCRPADLERLLVPERFHAVDSPVPVKVLQKHFRHLDALLPLPRNASGLVVFSQDHRVVRKFNEQAAQLEQECIVEVQGQIEEGGLERLCNGTAIRGEQLPRSKVSWQSEQRLRFALKGVYPEEIAAMCDGVGLRMTSLRRLRIGRISLAKLPEGHWRYALPWERF